MDTPATSLILSLHETLKTILSIGLDSFIKKHPSTGSSLQGRRKIDRLRVINNNDYSSSLTSVKVPDSINGIELLSLLQKRYNSYFAGGQDSLKGKIVRIAHLGFVDEFDLIHNLAIFEFALKDVGFSFELGTATSTAMKTIHQNQ